MKLLPLVGEPEGSDFLATANRHNAITFTIGSLKYTFIDIHKYHKYIQFSETCESSKGFTSIFYGP